MTSAPLRMERPAFPAHTSSNLRPSSGILPQAPTVERVSLLHQSQLGASPPGAALTPREDVDEERSWSCCLCHPFQSLLGDIDIAVCLWCNYYSVNYVHNYRRCVTAQPLAM